MLSRKRRFGYDIPLEMDVRDKYFNGKFPSFRKPELIGYFSLDCQRKFCQNLSQLKYISFPSDCQEVKFDLNNRIDETKRKVCSDEKLDYVLKWILSHNGGPLERIVDIVCFRGLLRLLMCTPYENREGWIINATKYKGIIYLCASDTDDAKERKQHITQQEIKFTSWGYKFEQYMTSAQPDLEPNGLEPNNENEEFCVMFTSKLNSHTIMYGAEMDGVESKSYIDNIEDLKKVHFLELKTNRIIQHQKQRENFQRFKLAKWWAQSFLVGIESVLCGFRDDKGLVHTVQRMNVSDFPKQSKRWWNPAECMNFCDRFLTFVKSVVTEECPEVEWKFEWYPDKNGGKVTYTKVTGSSKYNFLHKWYTEGEGKV